MRGKGPQTSTCPAFFFARTRNLVRERLSGVYLDMDLGQSACEYLAFRMHWSSCVVPPYRACSWNPPLTSGLDKPPSFTARPDDRNLILLHFEGYPAMVSVFVFPAS